MRQRPGHYGAWELKTGYRRTALLGFTCAIVIHAVAVAFLHYIPRTPDTPPPERLLRFVRSIPQLEPPGGLPTPGTGSAARGVADSHVGRPSDIPFPAHDESVEPGFTTTRFQPVEVLPHFEEQTDILAGALLVGPAAYRTAEHTASAATVYAELDAAGVDVPPQVVEKIKPEYPPQGIAYLFDADVVIRILIGAGGEVAEAFVVAESGVDMGFEESALNAVRQWLFHPAFKNGHSVPFWIDVPIAYRLVVSYDMSEEARKNLRTRVIF